MGAINNMTERYNVQASTILGTNYKITNIECSDYNPTIDGNITVTITVNDVYEDPVEGESVTVTCTDGEFTQLNGSTITSNSSVTGTTNSSGQFTLTYNCSVWGLITFTANNKTTQTHVTGFKQIATYAGGFYTLSVDGSKRLAKLRVSISSTNIASGESYKQTGFVPTSYRPGGTIVNLVTRLQTVELVISNNGDVSVYNPSGSTVSNFTGTTIAYWDY